MPSKYYQRNFQPGHYYHLFNRGAFKSTIFLDKKDYKTFIDILRYYLIRPLPVARSKAHQYTARKRNVKEVFLHITPSFELVTYCLMPNHYHFLIRQIKPPSPQNNPSTFIQQLSLAYYKYFATKYNHSGSLFQGPFKNVQIQSDEQLLYLSKYIHLNPQNLTKNLSNYPHSSYPAYIGKVLTPKWLHPEHILKLPYFSNSQNPLQKYQRFIEGDQNQPSLIKDLTLD